MQSNCGGGAGGVYNINTLVYKWFTRIWSTSAKTISRILISCFWLLVGICFCNFLWFSKKKKYPWVPKVRKHWQQQELDELFTTTDTQRGLDTQSMLHYNGRTHFYPQTGDLLQSCGFTVESAVTQQLTLSPNSICQDIFKKSNLFVEFKVLSCRGYNYFSSLGSCVLNVCSSSVQFRNNTIKWWSEFGRYTDTTFRW